MTYASIESISPLCKCGCGQVVKFDLKRKRFNEFVNKHGFIYARKERAKARLASIPKGTCKGCGKEIRAFHERCGTPRTFCSRQCYIENRRSEQEKADAQRRWMLKKKYGLTPADYDLMLASQGGCAVCGTSHPGSSAKYFAVDHNHNNGKVRGLLCSNCNRAIGLLKDSPKLLHDAARYLEVNGHGLG